MITAALALSVALLAPTGNYIHHDHHHNSDTDLKVCLDLLDDDDDNAVLVDLLGLDAVVDLSDCDDHRVVHARSSSLL